jgi:surface polysaccharide O-acyltransferase-like enzyme
VLAQGRFEGSYLAFYPQFFNGIYPQGNFEYGHLWFLLYLFVFSVIALPLFLYHRQASAQKGIVTLANLAQKPGGIFLFAVPLIMINLTLRGIWPGYVFDIVHDGANVIYFLTFFIYGFLLFADTRFQIAIDRQWKIAFALAFILELTRLWGPLEYTLHWIRQSVSAWCWIMAFLGFGHTYLNSRNKLLQYASEASLPFYVLHNLLITIIAFFVVKWPVALWTQILLISLASLVGTLVVYELLVRRSNLTRILFGLKPRAKAQIRVTVPGKAA